MLIYVLIARQQTTPTRYMNVRTKTAPTSSLRQGRSPQTAQTEHLGPIQRVWKPMAEGIVAERQSWGRGSGERLSGGLRASSLRREVGGRP